MTKREFTLGVLSLPAVQALLKRRPFDKPALREIWNNALDSAQKSKRVSLKVSQRWVYPKTWD